jgi:excisionase family DNA binding protein
MRAKYFTIKLRMIIAKSLTTKEVARLCRVSDATVKRWEDAGLLKSERTSGGHRRFRAEEVARFQREQNLGLKLSHGDESAVRAANRRRANKNHSHSSFFHSLVAGVEEEAACEVVGAHLQGLQLTDIFDRLICPAMSRVGELWYKGELTVSKNISPRRRRGARFTNCVTFCPCRKQAASWRCAALLNRIFTSCRRIWRR